MAKEDIAKYKFEPGKSGNPAGRPAGIPNTATRLKRFLELTQKMTNPVNGELEEISVAEQMDLAMIAKARKGDTKAYQALIDRLEGKAPQSVDVTSKGEKLNESNPVSNTILDKFVEDLKNESDEQARRN